MNSDAFDDTPCAPCAEALVAGTVALMTTWADPCRHARLDAAEQRALIARKIVSNLYFLREHPALSCGLRQVMGMAHERWVALAVQQPSASQPSPVSSPGALH
jgi:hypothetical protein